jgi:hypothetical protein
MESVSNFKFGIQLDKSVSVLSLLVSVDGLDGNMDITWPSNVSLHQHTTVEPWVSCLFTMLQMRSRSTVGVTVLNDYYAAGRILFLANGMACYFTLDVRTWFSNIEQHASEGVNRILIGNKCDMTDKKVSWLSAACFPTYRYQIPITQRGLTYVILIKCTIGHPYRERPGFSSRTWNQL